MKESEQYKLQIIGKFRHPSILWTRNFIRTLRDDPQDAEIRSYALLVRASMIRKVSAGIYTFLPLGLRVLQKIEKIIREEMNSAGAIEILMPALQPRELWDFSGRYKTMGEVMYKLKDRQMRDFILGPTHEEIVTELLSKETRSYRDLPVIVYQIQTKFRDEARPRFGLIRAKEFIMKDAYSFDTDWEKAHTSYEIMYKTYEKIFKRCGLKVKAVEADVGTMGGQSSHEFILPAEAGEDIIVECNICGYAANMEKAETKILEYGNNSCELKIESIHTPDIKTVQQVCDFLGCKPSELVKTIIYLADDTPVAVCVPGDREINEAKLARVLETSNLKPADEETIIKASEAPVGFAGPVGLKIPIYADIRLKNSGPFITGGNKKDTHLKNVYFNRDCSVRKFADICNVLDNDPCPRCEKGKLKKSRGIEIGHVFKLGTKYSKVFNTNYLDSNGNPKITVMGCYGIGVTRTLQAVVEQNNDKDGIIWPQAVAPYSCVIILLEVDNNECWEYTIRCAEMLSKLDIDFIIDDRDERAGVKFKDADLIGFPLRLVISKRSISFGGVELKLRTENTVSIVKLDDIPLCIKEKLNYYNSLFI